jgi:hypothetical protein
MEALIQCLRETKFGGQVAEPLADNPAARAAQLDKMLAAAEQQACMGLENSEGARAYIVQKLLLWEVTRGTVPAPDSTAALRGMTRAEEKGYLDTIPSYLARGSTLRARFHCPPVLLTEYARQAAPTLQQYPEALDVTLNNPERVRAALAKYIEAHGHTPSLRQLYAAVFAPAAFAPADASPSPPCSRRISQKKKVT